MSHHHPAARKRKPEVTHGLEKGFAKALKKGVNDSIKSRHLQQRREPSWWPRLPDRA